MSTANGLLFLLINVLVVATIYNFRNQSIQLCTKSNTQKRKAVLKAGLRDTTFKVVRSWRK